MSTKEKINELTDELKEVYEYVSKNTDKGGVNATQVGIVIGRKTSDTASAWGNYRLKKLIEAELVEKDDDTKKYTVLEQEQEDEPEPIDAASNEQEDEPEQSSDADDDEIPDRIANTDSELKAGKTIVEFEPHPLSKEYKAGMKKVRGLVTKVFFEDDGRRFTQVKMDHNGKRCFKRDRLLTVVGEKENENAGSVA